MIVTPQDLTLKPALCDLKDSLNPFLNALQHRDPAVGGTDRMFIKFATIYQ
jgi:hypothetical protein